MFFKNLVMFRFPIARDPLAARNFVDKLLAGADECKLKPVGPLELSSRGFISPFGNGSDEMLHHTGDKVWITIGGQDRMLPNAVVQDELAKKLDEIEQKEGRKPGGRTRKRIKDELIVDLLPRAFIKPSRTDAFLDLERGVLVVDTASRRVGENVVSEVRRALGSFPALPLNAEVAPRSVLTGWIAGEPLPDGLSLSDEATLEDPIDGGGVVKVSRQELQGDEVGKHLEAGKQVTRLGLTLDDHMSFALGEDLVVRKFKLLDGAVDGLANTADRDDLRAELDARFFLLTAEVGRLFDVAQRALKLTKAEA